MKKFVLFCFISLLFFFRPSHTQAQTITTVHLFASSTCPHCAEEKKFLSQYQNNELIIKVYDVGKQANSLLLSKVGLDNKIDVAGVPITIIGNKHLIGYANESTTGQEILELIKNEQQNPSEDIVLATIQKYQITPKIENLPKTTASLEPKEASGATNLYGDKKISLPFLGQIDPKKVSLPLITILIGLIDGFNPCAMWTLIFLISLLLGMHDRKRMWLLGGAFIVASGFIYFLFMAAWLNFFLFVGMIGFVRVAIGIFALTISAHYYFEYINNKDGTCKTDLGGKKQKIFDKLKEVTYREQLVFALIGIIFLAFAVNLVELICSIGLPAIYTNLLASSNISGFLYYFYLLIYIFFFMLDDMIVFIVAMTTLKMVGLDTKYSRYSHLIGSVILFVIALAMLFKPELLTFK